MTVGEGGNSVASEKVDVVFHDRYSATGTPRPDPKTVCQGHCEGMGFYPTQCRCKGALEGHRHEEDDEFQDGTWFCWVNCVDCGGTPEKRGTGKRPAA